MAGSWLKMRHDLIDAPEIRRLARRCGVTKDDVLGKLFRLWSWFDRHSVGGRVEDDDIDLVDEVVGHQGFAVLDIQLSDEQNTVSTQFYNPQGALVLERLLDGL